MTTTRKRLVDAARKLFGEGGIKNTTMNDIAMQSQKGRRTIYTYFKNKNEVIDAVIEEELQYILSSLEEVMKKDINPLDKFLDYVMTRMYVIKTAVQRNGSLQAEFFRDVIRVELVRRKMEKVEIKHLETILQDGIDQNLFYVSNVKHTAVFAHFVMRGLEVPYIRGMFDEPGTECDEGFKKRAFVMIKGSLGIQFRKDHKDI